MGIRSICVLLLTIGLLSSCKTTRPDPPGPPAFCTIGSTEKQVIKSMGPPTRITLDGDVEYWHYGDNSWIAMAANRVVKYNNQGALNIEKTGEDGVPSGPDIPDVKPPENDNIDTMGGTMGSVNQPSPVIRIPQRTYSPSQGIPQESPSPSTDETSGYQVGKWVR